MPAPSGFSSSQRAHLKALERACPGLVRIVGYDLANRLVVRRQDRIEETYAIKASGEGTDPIDPVLEFTIEDAYLMHGYDYGLLVRLCPTVEEEI